MLMMRHDFLTKVNADAEEKKLVKTSSGKRVEQWRRRRRYYDIYRKRKERLTIKRNGWMDGSNRSNFILNMSTTMDQVVKRAKDSFGPMFDKNLHDLVRGIRNHKDNEVRSLQSIH